ncbi:MAG: hypothetical protein PVI00_13685 [Desulfobacterales bacterium]|jgi:histidinol dehydrogenase
MRSAQKIYDRSGGESKRVDRDLERQLITSKISVHRAELCIAQLIKYTESNPESAQFIDQYSPEQLERYNNAQAKIDRLNNQLTELMANNQ